MGDLISRQAAINALDKQIELCNKALGSFDISTKDEYAIKVERASLKAYREQLENLPSAQPEIKTGRWIYEETQYKISSYRCSECGRHVLYESKSDVCEAYPYCHCGAKMVKTNEVYANEWLGL